MPYQQLVPNSPVLAVWVPCRFVCSSPHCCCCSPPRDSAYARAPWWVVRTWRCDLFRPGPWHSRTPHWSSTRRGWRKPSTNCCEPNCYGPAAAITCWTLKNTPKGIDKFGLCSTGACPSILKSSDLCHKFSMLSSCPSGLMLELSMSGSHLAIESGNYLSEDLDWIYAKFEKNGCHFPFLFWESSLWPN